METSKGGRIAIRAVYKHAVSYEERRGEGVTHVLRPGEVSPDRTDPDKASDDQKTDMLHPGLPGGKTSLTNSSSESSSNSSPSVLIGVLGAVLVLAIIIIIAAYCFISRRNNSKIGQELQRLSVDMKKRISSASMNMPGVRGVKGSATDEVERHEQSVNFQSVSNTEQGSPDTEKKLKDLDAQ